MGHSYDYYTWFILLNVFTPSIVVSFTYFYGLIIGFTFFFRWLCCYCCCSAFNKSNSKCEAAKKYCFDGFKAITVALARGFFGAVSIRRKDYMKPPCLKINGKLYEANAIVLVSLLHYVLVVLLVIVLVSFGYSVHMSRGLNECSKNADCFIVNRTYPFDVTDLTNCSLPYEVELENENVYVECFTGLQPAVGLALLGGYISLIPPLMFSFANFVHEFLLKICKCSNESWIKNIYLFSMIFSLSNVIPWAYSMVIFFKYSGEIQLNNSIAQFIFKDTNIAQFAAILITFLSFLLYPWFLLGKYRVYTKDELSEMKAEPPDDNSDNEDQSSDTIGLKVAINSQSSNYL